MNKTQKVTLLTSSLGLIAVMLNVSIVGPTLPSIQRGLSSSATELQWVVNTYNVIFASLLLAGGLLGDRLGHRRVFGWGLSLAALGALLSAVAPNIGVLVLARAVQGLGSSLIQPSSLSLLTFVFVEPKDRARAIGLWGAVSGLGIALGPILGGVLVDSLGWRTVFAPIALVALMALVTRSNGVLETPLQQSKRIDFGGLVSAVTTLFALSYALTQGVGLGWSSVPIAAAFTVTLVSGITFFQLERRHTHPLVDLRFFQQPHFGAANLAGLLSSFSTFGLLVFLGLFLQQGRGFSATQAGLITLLFPVGFALFSPLSGRLTAQMGPRLPATLGLALSGVTGLFFLQLNPSVEASQLWWVFLLWGAGMGLSTGALTQAALSGVPQQRAGMASSVLGALRQVGTALGVALLGTVIASGLQGSLAQSLLRLELASLNRTTVLSGVAREGLGFRADTLPGTNPEQVQLVVAEAYLKGLHVAIVIASLSLLGSSLLVWRAFPAGHQKPPMLPPDPGRSAQPTDF